jgi:hypothetical protein
MIDRDRIECIARTGDFDIPRTAELISPILAPNLPGREALAVMLADVILSALECGAVPNEYLGGTA